jgi:hypothetical protein
MAKHLIAGIILGGQLITTTASASTRQTWEGEAALKAHQERLRQEMTVVSAESETRSKVTNTNQSTPTLDLGTAGATSPAHTPSLEKSETTGQPSPARRPTREEILEARRKAAEERAQRRISAMRMPLSIAWPNAPQAPIKWENSSQKHDGYEVIQSRLKTPHNLLTSKLLSDYHPTSHTGDTGLTLQNRIRSELKIECYTFKKNSFLPDLEPETIEAYQQALPTIYKGKHITLVAPKDAQSEAGPPAADLLTRRVSYEIKSSDSAESTTATAVSDYFIPLEKEWLVIRFTAPPQLFHNARKPVEDFLRNLALHSSG